MKRSIQHFQSRVRFFGAMLFLTSLVPAFIFSQNANPSAVPMLTVGTYGALAYSGITGAANVTGDVGSSTASISTNVIASGTKYAVGAAHTLQAQADLTAALSNIAGRSADETIAADALGGKTFTRGVYSGGALDLAANTTVTLDGSASDLFIFKASTTLQINTNTTIALINGAQWSNVYWSVGTSATILNGSIFNGNILSTVSITLNTGATIVNARLLANTGAVTINSDVLPVELTSFTVSAGISTVALRWATATEVNNHGFEVERRHVSGFMSQVSSDRASTLNPETSNSTWNRIGFVEGNGNSNSLHEYSYVDRSVSAGLYAFRLKQIDRDGKFTYSPTVEAAVGEVPKEFSLVQNFPNPFNPSTVIAYRLAAPAQVTLRIYTLIGEEIATLVNTYQQTGTYSVPFSTVSSGHHLSSGVYFYRLEAKHNGEGRSGTFISTKKLTFMK